MKKDIISLCVCILGSLMVIGSLFIKIDYKDCGVIIDKPVRQETRHKSTKITNEKYLIVQYTSDGYIDGIKPTANDYYKNEIGSKVCYNRTDESNHLVFSFFFVGGFITVVTGALIRVPS